MNKVRARLLVMSSLGLAAPHVAMAQGATTSNGSNEIIVTAQKREQSINDVGLTIQAATADTLKQRGIESVADLGKLVPGFTYTESVWVTPVYTLRGIGLYDATFGAVPAVAIYNDQIPRNYAIMSDAIDLDLERIEVLKGPQGTLFGQSSTGGAINYIQAKPTSTLQAGFDLSYERFDRVQASGFISGPITETLRARLAGRITQGGDWQRSISRPGDENGKQDRFEGRLSLDWEPSDRVRFQAGLTGVRDKSDVQAGQYAGTDFNIYSAASLAAANANPATANPYGIVDNARYADLTTPASASFDPTFLGRQNELVTRMNGVNPLIAGTDIQSGAQAILGTPVRSDSIRAADWTEGLLRGSDNKFFQAYLRADFELSDQLTLTNITAYADKKIHYNTDLDATSARSVDVPIDGRVRVFNQEIRLAGDMDRLKWLIGANYDKGKTRQDNFYDLTAYSGNNPLGFTNPDQFIGKTLNEFNSKLETIGIFANGEYKISDNLTINAGIRYTENKQSGTYCYSDPGLGVGGSAPVAAVFTILQGAISGNPNLPAIQANQCFPLGDGFYGTTFGVPTIAPVTRSLKEDNWSFRVGLDYKFDGGTLIYATVSQGYKAGLFSAIGASGTQQYSPALQEKLIAYEAGFKAPFANRRVNLNAAVFYYDYSDKQVRGRVNDQIYGLLEKMVNVPKSYVFGVEGELSARPLDGLSINASATYLNAKVDGEFRLTAVEKQPIYNAAGYAGNFDGSLLPFTPKFSANADIQYEWDVGGVRPFIGGGLHYQGKQNTTFFTDDLPADNFEIDEYTTFDARVGVGAEDGSWQVTAFGRNITNKRYITAITSYLDSRYVMTGRPAVYGVSARFRFR